MASFRWPLVIFLALALGAASARAADPAYPPGSRIGLAPPAGLAPSKNFFGYEDPDHKVAVILVALPTQAYADLDRSVTADALKRQGVTLESREAVPLSTGKAFLVIGHQEIDNTKIRKWILVASSPALTALVTVQMPEEAKAFYPDAAIRAALATLAIRNTVPIEEQLSLLPFKIGELAGFRIGGVVPGRAVMLSDAAVAPGSPEGIMEPHIFVAIAPGAPAQSSERDAFARDVFATIPNLKDVRIRQLRAAADRRPAGPPDSRQRQRCSGRLRADGGAMAALRRQRLYADDRDRAHRQPGQAPIRASAPCATASSRADRRSRSLAGLRVAGARAHHVQNWRDAIRAPSAMRRHLRPHHVGIDRGLSDPGAVAAIAAGDDVLAADELRVAPDALRDQFRMLDEIRLGFDDAGNEHLARGQLDALEQRPFVARGADWRPRTRSRSAAPRTRCR